MWMHPPDYIRRHCAVPPHEKNIESWQCSTATALTACHFARIGDGSLGGKGPRTGISSTISSSVILSSVSLTASPIQIPKTVVLCTGYLRPFHGTEQSVSKLLSAMPATKKSCSTSCVAQLPDSLIADFFTFFEATKSPIAIRSSSLPKIPHYQPFARNLFHPHDTISGW